MDGKKIIADLELENGYHILKLDDDTFALIKVVSPDISKDELVELLGDKPEKAETKAKEEKPAKEEEPVTEESYTWDDLLGMDHGELKELCDDNDLDTDPDDYEDEGSELMAFRKEIAEEIDIEVPKDDTSAESKKEPKEEVKDDDYTWDDLKEMDYDELEELCEEQDLDTDPDDYDEDEEDKLRVTIAEELEITVPEKPKKKKRK